MLVIGYEAVLRTGRVAGGHGVGQYQRNVVQSETFVFGGREHEDMAVVGSSLTANIMEAFQKVRPAEDLAMGGESSLTGLALVVDAPHGLRRVVIELSQALSVPTDPKLTALTEAPLTSVAVRNVWALRQEYQPANVLSRYLAKSTGGGQSGPPRTLPQAIRAPMIADVVKLFSVPPSKGDIQVYSANLAALRVEVDAASRKGIQCELFWPPIDAAMNQSPRLLAFYAMARAAFPPPGYTWLAVDYTGAAQTNDGYHLLFDDAQAYGRALAVAATR